MNIEALPLIEFLITKLFILLIVPVYLNLVEVPLVIDTRLHSRIQAGSVTDHFPSPWGFDVEICFQNYMGYPPRREMGLFLIYLLVGL